MGKYETPDYTVILKDDPFEVRSYGDFYMIEYDNDFDPNMDAAFGSLFRYISSDNKDSEKIAMTVPVIEEMMENKMKMAFIVPSKYGELIPEPNNPHLSIKKFEHGQFAVIRYGGLSNKSKERHQLQKLEKWISDNDFRIQSNYMLAFYNAPYVPPFLRRNEIMVRIDEVTRGKY